MRSETTYPEPRPTWSSSQMLSLSSTNYKITTRRISTRWKLPWSDPAAQAKLTLLLIPAHCGIQGNEKADRRARERGQQEQEDRYTSYTDEKIIIKTLSKKKKMKAATPRL